MPWVFRVFLLLVALVPERGMMGQSPPDSMARPEVRGSGVGPTAGDSSMLTPASFETCEPAAYCEGWQTASLRASGPADAARISRVRSLLDTLSSSPFQMPSGGRINTSFSVSHTGWDIDLELGDTVSAASAGRVRYVGYDRRGYGNVVVVRHPSGLETLYAHLQRPLVEVSQDVTAGDVIGLGGSTGRSTGPHLHFEVRLWDLPLDPGRFMTGSIGTPMQAAEGATSVEERAWRGEGQRVVVRIRRGDTLSGLARRHGTTVARLRQLNGLRPGQVIRAGSTLRVR